MYQKANIKDAKNATKNIAKNVEVLLQDIEKMIYVLNVKRNKKQMKRKRNVFIVGKNFLIVKMICVKNALKNLKK